MNTRKLLMFIGVAAGLVSGFAVRWLQHGGSQGVQTPAPPPSLLVTTAKHPPSASLAGRRVTPLAAELKQQLSMSSGVTRWLEWMTALEKATLADFPHLARMAKSDPTALRMVAARWIELNP